jgi:hypothetical protein
MPSTKLVSINGKLAVLLPDDFVDEQQLRASSTVSVEQEGGMLVVRGHDPATLREMALARKIVVARAAVLKALQ